MRDSPIAVLADQNGSCITSAADSAGGTRLAVDARITGASGNTASVITDGTARRLQVETRNAGTSGFNLINRYLLNGTASNMKVVGSAASPVYFSYAPPANSSVTVTRLNLLLVATTITFSGGLFGNQGPLTNGITCSTTVNGATSVSTTLRQNEDFLLFSLNPSYVPGTAGGLLGGGVNGILGFSLAITQTLSSSTGDSIGVNIRDNLSTAANVQYLQGSVQGFINT